MPSLQALSTALASTIGTGSIAGVAAAINLGGPGAVFWMWVSAFLGMATSFGEKLLSVRYQRIAGPRRVSAARAVLCSICGMAWALPCWRSGSPGLSPPHATLAGGFMVQVPSPPPSTAFGWVPGHRPGAPWPHYCGGVMVGGWGRIARVSQAWSPHGPALSGRRRAGAAAARAAGAPGL